MRPAQGRMFVGLRNPGCDRRLISEIEIGRSRRFPEGAGGATLAGYEPNENCKTPWSLTEDCSSCESSEKITGSAFSFSAFAFLIMRMADSLRQHMY